MFLWFLRYTIVLINEYDNMIGYNIDIVSKHKHTLQSELEIRATAE